MHWDRVNGEQTAASLLYRRPRLRLERQTQKSSFTPNFTLIGAVYLIVCSTIPSRGFICDSGYLCLAYTYARRCGRRLRSVHTTRVYWPCSRAVNADSLRASSFPVESYLADRNTADRKSSFVVATPPQHSAIPLSARNQQQYRPFVEVYLHITLYQIT